jgi:hypothetical protein
MGDRRDDILQQRANKRQQLLQIENGIARLIAELEKIDAALARLRPFNRAPDAIVN